MGPTKTLLFISSSVLGASVRRPASEMSIGVQPFNGHALQLPLSSLQTTRIFGAQVFGDHADREAVRNAAESSVPDFVRPRPDFGIEHADLRHENLALAVQVNVDTRVLVSLKLPDRAQVEAWDSRRNGRDDCHYVLVVGDADVTYQVGLLKLVELIAEAFLSESRTMLVPVLWSSWGLQRLIKRRLTLIAAVGRSEGDISHDSWEFSLHCRPESKQGTERASLWVGR